MKAVGQHDSNTFAFCSLCQLFQFKGKTLLTAFSYQDGKKRSSTLQILVLGGQHCKEGIRVWVLGDVNLVKLPEILYKSEGAILTGKIVVLKGN